MYIYVCFWWREYRVDIEHAPRRNNNRGHQNAKLTVARRLYAMRVAALMAAQRILQMI